MNELKIPIQQLSPDVNIPNHLQKNPQYLLAIYDFRSE